MAIATHHHVVCTSRPPMASADRDWRHRATSNGAMKPPIFHSSPKMIITHINYQRTGTLESYGHSSEHLIERELPRHDNRLPPSCYDQWRYETPHLLSITGDDNSHINYQRTGTIESYAHSSERLIERAAVQQSIAGVRNLGVRLLIKAAVGWASEGAVLLWFLLFSTRIVV